jgi:hypothetical protein
MEADLHKLGMAVQVAKSACKHVLLAQALKQQATATTLPPDAMVIRKSAGIRC